MRNLNSLAGLQWIGNNPLPFIKTNKYLSSCDHGGRDEWILQLRAE